MAWQMLERWTDKLLRFDMLICHVPGAENVVADGLSRQSAETTTGFLAKLDE
jgi:hypothetical protein